MQFHAADVFVSAAGDYYQLHFLPKESYEEKSDPHEVRGPYLIVQKQFEMLDDGLCYIETHDEDYIGYFPLRLMEIGPARLEFEIVRSTDNRVEVSFALSPLEFEDVKRVAEVIFGLKEPDYDGDEDW